MTETATANQDSSFQQRVENFMQRVADSQGSGDNDITSDLGNLRFTIYQAGKFVDKKTGEEIEFEKGIKIKNGKNAVKLTAVELAFVFRAIAESTATKELRIRLKEEQQVVSGLSF